MRIKLTVLFFFIYQFIGVSADQIASPFNNLEVRTDSIEGYDFFASGHFHGSGTNYTGYPINSLLANIDQLNNSNASFVVCLGDLFLDVSNDIPYFEKSFFQKLKIPLFNTVGNHDLSGSIYQEKYGKTDYQFVHSGDLHLFFDTETNNGSFEKGQLELLNGALEKVKSGQIRQVFIYCHRTIWAKHYQAMEGLFSDNTQSIMGNNFSDEVYPLIKKISEKVSVTWFSGSIGNAPASFFYHKDEEQSITYIATAIRGLKRDAWLKVSVDVGGSISYKTISLTGQKLKYLEEYDANFWQTTSAKQPFNYRLIPYYIKLVVLHRAFWYGVITTVLMFAALWWFFRRKRKSIQ